MLQPLPTTATTGELLLLWQLLMLHEADMHHLHCRIVHNVSIEHVHAIMRM